MASINILLHFCALSLLLLCISYHCSASRRLLLDPKRPSTIEFGLDPPSLLRASFPAPPEENTQTPSANSMIPTIPSLQQPMASVLSSPPPPPNPSVAANFSPSFPFPTLPSLPNFPPFPFLPTMPSIPSVPLPPQFRLSPVVPSEPMPPLEDENVNSGFTSSSSLLKGQGSP